MSDTLRFYEEIDLQKIVDELARRLQRNVDEAALDKAADTLAGFGYVKADGKSRWFQLFGTPERAARTLQEFDPSQKCRDCMFREDCMPVKGPCYYESQDALLEWLKQEVDA